MTDETTSSGVDASGAPAACVEHFEPFDQDLANEYPQRIGAIRERCPVLWSDAHWSETSSGFWVLTRYDDVLAAAQNWQRFSSAQGAAPVQFDLDVFRMIPLETDPPIHRNIRHVLTPFFAPEALKGADEGIRTIVQELLQACARQSPCDFISAFTVTLPSRVFFEIFLGEDPKEIAWIIEIIDMLFAKPESAAEKAPDLLMWCAQVLESRRTEGRRDDVLGAVAHAGNTPDFTLTEMERIQTVMLLILAGMETTATALGHVGYRLASDTSFRAELGKMDGPRLDRAIDELLRIDSPVPAAGRTLTEDTTIGSCPMAKGDRVFVSWLAANRDPKAFPNPDELDLTREAGRHLAFGAGQHRCLGSHLAKRELRYAIEEICKLSVFDLVPVTEITYRAGPARGPASLPISLAL
jgi:cytochrome P450